jgi:hypothetical protein
LLVCVKSYGLREGSTVIEVKVAKTGRAWKFGFCSDMSLALEVLAIGNSQTNKTMAKEKREKRERSARLIAQGQRNGKCGRADRQQQQQTARGGRR